jgi:ABC-type amino acid transport substrate-binding protein/serine phosphatase RsbU (regulator of sigma subunit)
MKKILLILLIPLFLYSGIFNNVTKLSKKEQKWIETHTISIGVEEWNPIVFLNDNGEIDGIAGDFLKEIIEDTKLKVKFVPGEWKVLLNKLKNRELDLLTSVYMTKKRLDYGLYSKDYFQIKDYIYVRDSEKDINSLKDLEGKVLAIKQENGNIELIRKRYPKIKFLFTKNLDESIEKILNREVDAIYSPQIVMQKQIENNLIIGLRGISQEDFKAKKLYFLINKDKKILQSIINKSLQNITREKRIEILSKWIIGKKHYIHLSDDEQKWLDKHKTIRFTGDPNWLPFEAFNDDGKYIGIMADFLKDISETLNITIEHVQPKDWNDAIAMIKSKKVDVITETTDSPLRKFLEFTHPILDNEIIIAMHTTNNYVKNLNKIKDKKIVMIKNYGYVRVVKKKYPDIDFIFVKDIDEALSGISTGKYDALLATSTLVSYTISQMGINNVKIVGTTKLSTKIAWGVRKEYKPLVDILNRAIDTITVKEKSEILNSWVKQQTLETTDYTLALQIVGALILLVIFILFNNYKLKSMVADKTVELQNLLDSLEIKVQERTIDLQNTKNALEEMYKHTQESIEYASLIQSTLIPDNELFEKYFRDYFTIWEPKDTVGGDVYLFEELRDENECLLMVIDCTGHGVPGAFVTMLVKAIERSIVLKIKHGNERVSPSDILSVFNKTMKHLLKQDSDESISNAGFDGAVIYYNKNDKIIRFAGAQLGLFYIEDDEIKTIKGSRHSIGYKRSDPDFEFKEHILHVRDMMQFYITTDGYIDQNGGEKGFPFGKKRFKNILMQHHKESMTKQKDIFLNTLSEYQGDEERNDDITLVGFKI